MTGLAMLLVGLAGCGGDPSGKGAPAVPGASLTGLYESGNGPRRDQLCMIEREGRTPTFGFVSWGAGDKSCGGKGIVRRQNGQLRLLLDGDESCAIEARMDGDRITLAAPASAECARYYCGEGAAIPDTPFIRSGGTEEDARRAVDLVGDPLCGGS